MTKLSNRGITSAGLLIGFLLIVLVGLGGWYSYKTWFAADASQTQEQNKSSTETISYKGENGKSALDLLLQVNTNVEIQDSPYGKYVAAINGVQGGTDNKYWIFYINGEPAQVGAGDYQTTTDDQIEWRFE